MLGSVVVTGAGGGGGWAEWAQILTGFLNLVAAGVVAFTAWRGLSTWRQEARAKRGMELGEQVLTLGYECADVIRHMRNPFSMSTEQDAIKRREAESDGAYHARRTYEPTFLRYQASKDKFAELLALRYRSAALLTEEHGKAIEDVQRLANDLIHAANQAHWIAVQLARDQSMFERNFTQYNALLDKQHKHEDTLWGLGIEADKPDEFDDRIKATIKNLERLFKRVAVDGEL